MHQVVRQARLGSAYLSIKDQPVRRAVKLLDTTRYWSPTLEVCPVE